MNHSPTCVCAHNRDGSVTTMLCSVHADQDPCLTMARTTGKRRHGSIVRGRCTNCGWAGGATRYDGPAHPDYPNMVWSHPQVEALVMRTIQRVETPAAAATEIQKLLDRVGYDSMDREMAFWIASQLKGWEYDDIYDAWLGV